MDHQPPFEGLRTPAQIAGSPDFPITPAIIEPGTEYSVGPTANELASNTTNRDLTESSLGSADVPADGVDPLPKTPVPGEIQKDHDTVPVTWDTTPGHTAVANTTEVTAINESGRPGTDSSDAPSDVSQEASGAKPSDTTPPNVGETVQDPEELNIIRAAVKVAETALDQGAITDGAKNGHGYSNLAKWAQDPKIAEKVTSPSLRARTLAMIAADSGNEAVAAKATETALTVEDPLLRRMALQSVARETRSLEPLDHITNPEERDLCIRVVATDLEDMSLVEHIQGPRVRELARTDVAIRTNDAAAASAITNQYLKDTALSQIATATRDPSLLADVADQDTRDNSLCEIAIAKRDEGLAETISREELRETTLVHVRRGQVYDRLGLGASYANADKKAQLLPLDKMDTVENPGHRLRYLMQHLELGGNDPETVNAIAQSAGELARGLDPRHRAEALTSLTRLTGDKRFALEVLGDEAILRGDQNTYWQIVDAARAIQSIDHPGRL